MVFLAEARPLHRDLDFFKVNIQTLVQKMKKPNQLFIDVINKFI